MVHKSAIRKNITGQKFGSLTAIKPSESKKGFWVFSCDCGATVERESKGTKHEASKGSNCCCSECLKEIRSRIGKRNDQGKGSSSNKKLYDVHRQMMRRCYDSKSADFKNYGARGISVCDEWHSQNGFYLWCDVSGYKEGLTIERGNVDGNYCPENCTWIDNKLQARNTRKVTRLFFDGKLLSLPEWSDLLGINQKTIKSRIRYGWPIEKVLSEKVGK